MQASVLGEKLLVGAKASLRRHGPEEAVDPIAGKIMLDDDAIPVQSISVIQYLND